MHLGIVESLFTFCIIMLSVIMLNVVMLSFVELAGVKPDEFIAPGFTVNYDTSLNWLKMLFTDSSLF